MGLSTAAKVGLVTILGLSLLAAVVAWKTEIFMIGQGYEVIASFENIEGLTIGSEVRFRGSKIGKVMKIDPGPYDIKIFSVVDKSIKIPADSVLRVSYDGIVGVKYLEIKPGTSEVMYVKGEILPGTRTSAIVDFVDIGSKNLEETRAILQAVRKIIENPALQHSFVNAVVVADRTAIQLEELTKELRATNKGIQDIVADPKFQANVKGTIHETERTLSSANAFFANIGRVNMRASGGVDVGSTANAVRGDVDIIQSDQTYYRLGFGEGPSRTPALLDFLLTNKSNDRFGFRLGVINSQLGGGLVLYPNAKGNILADIYDINNPRPNNPKVRLGYEHEMQDYMDLLLQGDDLLNAGSRNYMFGVRVKPQGQRLF
ncbi:MAG: MlaD family protein [Candidatus Margulisiibacteriota bacterium]